MSDDIRDILQRFTALEAKLSPTSTKKGLTPQQDSVPQLPALFKPKKISVLGTNKDPEHPAHGYAVGSNESAEPATNKLAETMANIEEDMLSKVKKDLTQYLDRLERKVAVDRELKDKAKDAVEKGRAEEDIEENDYELTDPETVHDVEDKIDAKAAQPQAPVAPVQTETLEDGTVFEIHGDDLQGYRIRHGDRELRSHFGNRDDASMAIRLFGAHRRANQHQDPSSDYLNEK